MRNKIKTSGVNRKGPRLAVWARKLRNWLDTYLSEDAVPSPESEAMPPEQEDSAVQSHPKEVSAAMEHWRELARKAAPEWLTPEESNDLQQGPVEILSQTTEEVKEVTLQEGEAQKPESNPASAASYPASKSPSGRQQPWSAEPQMDRTAEAESAAPRPVLELRTSRHIEEASKTEASRKEARSSRMSQQREQISDARYSRAFFPSDIGEEQQAGSIKKQNKDTLVQKMMKAASVASPRLRKTVNKVWAFFKGRNGKETADRTSETPVELDSAPPLISSPAVESRHASKKNLAPNQLPADPSARKLVRKEAGTPPAVLEWERTADKAAAHAQPSLENARPERPRRPLVTEDVPAKKTTTMRLDTDGCRTSGPQADLWPDRPETDPWPELPDAMSLSSLDWMESLRSREHIYALDAEQQGGS